MILKEYFIEELNLKYFVGINQISVKYHEYLDLNKLKNDNDAIEFLISLSSQINEKYDDIIIQFIDDEFILNKDHIQKSIYFVYKAFIQEVNISNSKSMEVLLYLSSQRQIKKSIKAFGVKIQKLKHGNLTYLISSRKNIILNINQEILDRLNAKNAEITINNISEAKLDKIQEYYNISSNQITSIMNSYEKIKFENDKERLNLLMQAIHDILCEKMSILSLEKIKSD